LATPLELVLGARRFLGSEGSGDTSSSSEMSRLPGREASLGIAAGGRVSALLVRGLSHSIGDRASQGEQSLCDS
jgi:hypothetical protein